MVCSVMVEIGLMYKAFPYTYTIYKCISVLSVLTDKRTLVSEGVLNIVACKDGRQLLTISKASKKDAGLYECNATNALGTATSSCTLAVARKNRMEMGSCSPNQSINLFLLCILNVMYYTFIHFFLHS